MLNSYVYSKLDLKQEKWGSGLGSMDIALFNLVIDSSNASVIATMPFMFSVTIMRIVDVEQLIDFTTSYNARQYEKFGTVGLTPRVNSS